MRGKTMKKLKNKMRALGFDVTNPRTWRRVKKAYNKVWRPNREKYLRIESI